MSMHINSTPPPVAPQAAGSAPAPDAVGAAGNARTINEIAAGNWSPLTGLGIDMDGDIASPGLPEAHLDEEKLLSAMKKFSSLDMLELLRALIEAEKHGREATQGKRLEKRDEVVTEAMGGADALREAADKNFNVAVVMAVVGVVSGVVSIAAAGLSAIAAVVAPIGSIGAAVSAVISALNSLASAATQLVTAGAGIYGAFEGKNAADLQADATTLQGESKDASSKEEEEAELTRGLNKLLEDVEKLLAQMLQAQEQTTGAILRNM